MLKYIVTFVLGLISSSSFAAVQAQPVSDYLYCNQGEELSVDFSSEQDSFFSSSKPSTRSITAALPATSRIGPRLFAPCPPLMNSAPSHQLPMAQRKIWS